MSQGNQHQHRNQSQPSRPAQGGRPSTNPYDDADPIRVRRTHHQSIPAPASGAGQGAAQPESARLVPGSAAQRHVQAPRRVEVQRTNAHHPSVEQRRAALRSESAQRTNAQAVPQQRRAPQQAAQAGAGRGAARPASQGKQPAQRPPRHQAPKPTPQQIEAARREELRRQYHEVSPDRAYAPSARRSTERAERQYASQQRRQEKHPDRHVRPRPIPGDDYFRTPDVVFERGTQAQSPVTKRVNHAPAIIACLVALAIVGVVAYAWMHRTVQVTVDDKQVNVVVNSTLEQVLDASGQKVSPGNLVAVTGDVITPSDGHAFSATINGNAVDDDQLASTTVKGGEDIKFGNGDDRTEDYDVVNTTTVQPQLKMEGTEGSVFYVKQWGKTGTIETRKGKQSGKTADVTSVDVQDLIIQRQGIAPDNDQKLVALTFDDGPSQYTDKYLDILDQYGIKATFFELGQQVDEYPDAAKRVVSDGMQLGSHTWDHKQLTKLNEQQVSDELGPSFQKIQDVTGYQTTMLRQPYGSINDKVWLYSKGTMSVSVFWTHDSEDWKVPGVDKLVSNATKDMFTGAIILMHDGGGNRDEDVQALPQIIEAWQNAGYQFVTISDLMKSDPRIPDEVTSGDEQMPSDAVWPTEISKDSTSNAIP
ncbi:MAG: polysaccharide deacetylase family protein [Coriobacteriales bacterium]|nr:polysaccharide deacetylase family protein [Coriobacteriales bacterium]